MPRSERRWYDGIATTLRTVLSSQREPDPELVQVVRRLEQLD